MAVGYKLATQGVLGSDMYVGFFGGDQHHFETLPLQHVLEALSFRLLGPGVLQARLVSLIAAISIVWSVGWLALRWYGVADALVCELLLVGWRSNLTAASDGLPLLGIARTARYDVIALAMAWLALVALDAALRRPSPARGLAVGLASGLAALAQFFGAFVFPLVALGYVWNSRPARRSPTWVWIVAGAVVVLAPYVVYAARYPADLAGQLAVFGDRGAFWKPNFFVDNVLAEPRRYAHLVRWPPGLDLPGPSGLLEAPLSPWLLVIGIWPALAYLAWRGRAADRIGDRLLIASFVCFGGLLLLLDQTKVPLYALLLLPSVCLCVAAGLVAGVSWSLSRWWTRWTCLSASAALALALALEGVHAYQVDWTAANQVTPYLALGQQIDDALAPGARVLGPERWWWALHERPYLSLRSVWFQWTARAAQGERPEFSDWVVNTQTDSLIVNINIRDDVRAFPEALQAQF